MDYCSSCRRHLNGALVCPGCGAYAPDIAPHATDGRSGSALAMTGAPAATTADTWHDRPLGNDAEFDAGTDAAFDAHAAEAEELPPARQGRAARRRQLVRWKKNKRRAAVASAVALVGGGLTIATMDRHSTDQAQAATAPDDRSMGVAQEQTPEQNRPASTPATAERTHRSSHTPSQPQTTNSPQQQSLTAPPRATPPIARPDAAAPARPAAIPTRQAQSTAPSAGNTAPDRSDTATQQPSAPATSGGTHSGTSQTGPALVSTSPTEVCLLVVCLG
ncbi:hypothetical protein HEP83_08540 [Streptomyces sp. RLA2-12]|nr:hypothetical protein [Streptomyces sp. RLA2-12]QDN55194.1 hypothetical protein FNV67_07375 [Streptomyces sp. S1D4-20]QDN65373.1 hypothetical protein FNV66_06975 [Streptomyces sp. S1D4-14]QDO47780.1 hypothetical protein FNV60_05215 [Streptomyces sp. RLB3-5]QDO58019.1 hypothetical protein FNV59_07455 [Streptomyces sp. RLB1-8]